MEIKTKVSLPDEKLERICDCAKRRFDEMTIDADLTDETPGIYLHFRGHTGASIEDSMEEITTTIVENGFDYQGLHINDTDGRSCLRINMDDVAVHGTEAIA